MFSLQEAREAQAVKEVNELLKQEIAQRREAEQTLRKTQGELVQAGKLAALGHMSAAIAHELNQPVTAIRTFIASCRIFIERRQLEKVGENLGYIDELTTRMSSITRQLKTFARKSKGLTERVDPVEVIERVVVYSGPQFAAAGVVLQRDMPPKGVAVILGDDLQLEQVITNLLLNGLDAMHDSSKKEMRLRLAIEGEYAVFTCSDSGPGISQTAMEKLFDPFYTTKEIGEGLGLGLSISYGIIQEMHGTITAGNNPDGGAVFTLRLPLAKSPVLENKGAIQ